MVWNMKYLFAIGIFVAFAAVMFGAGMAVGNARCRVRVAATENEYRNIVAMKLNNIQRNVYEESVHRGVGDIRRILHQKYTIAM